MSRVPARLQTEGNIEGAWSPRKHTVAVIIITGIKYKPLKKGQTSSSSRRKLSVKKRSNVIIIKGKIGSEKKGQTSSSS